MSFPLKLKDLQAMRMLPSRYVYLQQFISECRCLIPRALNIHSGKVSVKTLQSFRNLLQSGDKTAAKNFVEHLDTWATKVKP